MKLAVPIDRNRLTPGTALVVSRRGYRHHGIYVGNERVIHYVGGVLPPKSGRIEDTSLYEFHRNRPIVSYVTPETPTQAQQIVARARSRLGERGYHLMRNNCEHFSHWCRFGVARSAQVELVVQLVPFLRTFVRPQSPQHIASG